MVRAQSKYGLMGSSAKTGKKNFCRSQQQFLDKTVIWDRTPPQLYIKYSVYVWERAQGSQIFKWNSIISIRSKVMAFLVILLSPWSSCCPHHPHVIPVLSPSSPRHPHSPQKVPMWFQWLWSPLSPPHVVPMLSPCRPRHPHVIPVSSPLSPCCPRHPHVVPIAPRRSPCGFNGCGLCGLHCLHPMLSPCCPRGPRVIPVIPTSSLCHPHHPRVVPVIPTLSP